MFTLNHKLPGKRFSMRTLITNGHIVTAIADYEGDILIDGEKVAAVSVPGAFASLQVDTVLDAQGKYIFPGAIDVHTHMELPLPATVASDDFETGTIAAACGGTTTIIDFANQQRGHTLADALQTWHNKADGKAVIDYGFHITITDLAAAPEAAMDDMISAGVTTFKLLMAYPGTFMVDDETIYRVLRRSAKIGGLVMVHAENGIVIDLLVREAVAAGHTAPGFHALTRPAILEGEAAQRAITLAAFADAPLYIVHVSCAHALHTVAAARVNGLPGVQHRVVLLYEGVRTGKLALQHFVDLIATAPAKLFGLYPRKGTIAPGSDADLVIFNPERKMTISAATQHQRVDYTPYEGMQVQGIPETVLLRGSVMVRDGEYVGGKGGGQYLHRATFSDQLTEV